MRITRILGLFLLVAACGGTEEATFHPAATQLRSSLTTPGDYFASPWPDDRRLDPDGFFVGSEFPNPHQAGIFDVVLQKTDGLVKGWSLSAPIYVPFTGSVDAKLPDDPAAYLRADAPFFLVAIDPGSPAYGARVPLEVRPYDDPTPWLPGHVLAIRPVRGFGLAPATKYALVVTTRLKDAKGQPVGPDRAFFDATRSKTAGTAQDRALYAPVLAFLEHEKLLTLDEVAGAVVFTTQDGTGELRRMRDWLEAQPAAQVHDLASDDTVKKKPLGVVLLKATYDAPNFMHGTPVYETDGGEFVFDAAGNPVPNKQEKMRLSICLPASTVPSGGFPVVFVSHGTGGDWHSYVEDRTCERLAEKGIASFGIDNVLHGPRAEGATSCFGMPAENCWLNPVNPVSSRNLLRQAALDHVSLRRLVEGLTVPAALAGQDVDVTFDLRNPGFFGHSQGGLTGSLYLAIDKKIAGGLLSGSGGHVTTTLLERQDTNGQAGTVREQAESLLFNMTDEHLGQFHPAMAFLQEVAEVADPLTYASSWLRAPDGRRKNVLLINGLKDTETPPGCSIAYAVQGGVPQYATDAVADPAFTLAGLMPVTGPFSANIPAQGALPAVTATYRQFPGADHFPAFDDASAVKSWTTFLDTLVNQGVATMPAP